MRYNKYLKDKEQKILKELNQKKEMCLNDVDGSGVVDCSSVKTCYDHNYFRYDNDNCKNTYESCGSWKTDGKLLEGCILSKFCGKTGEYLSDNNVEFSCHDEMKTWPDDNMEEWPRQWDPNNRVWELVDHIYEQEREDARINAQKEELKKVDGEALDKKKYDDE